MKISFLIAYFVSFLVIYYTSPSEAIKCVQCKDDGVQFKTNTGSDTTSPLKPCDPLPEAEDCELSTATQCLKSTLGGKVSRTCVGDGFKDSCIAGQCFYVCKTDGCNSVSGLRSSIAVFILSFIMYYFNTYGVA